jgi:hypothetical protein
MTRILICGGYGTFGLRAAERLGRDGRLHLILAGRNEQAARDAVAILKPRIAATLSAAMLDATTPDSDALKALAPRVIYNASGPFQAQDTYALARAAIAVGAHYIDLADARDFVAGFDTLDAEARAANVTLIAGASSVPGLSSAVIEDYKPRFAQLTGITYGIVPANGFDPGLATTASILSYVGQPFTTLTDGHMTPVHGWQGLWRYRFPGLGGRLLGHCDIPDLALFPRHYPDLRTIKFSAGLEVPVMHLGLWGVSWLVRAGLLRRPERLAKPLLALKKWLHRFGSDAGGMFMLLEGRGHDGHAKRLSWQSRAVHSTDPRDDPDPSVDRRPVHTARRDVSRRPDVARRFQKRSSRPRHHVLRAGTRLSTMPTTIRTPPMMVDALNVSP